MEVKHTTSKPIWDYKENILHFNYILKLELMEISKIFAPRLFLVIRL